ncbi:MAG: response regulator [Patescibacteria group bacterium]
MEIQHKTKKVLIVDDDNFLLSMYSFKFKESGFEVTSVVGGAEALGLLRGGDTFDIILLDLMMPIVNGFELMEALKKENLAPETKLIVFSNLGQSSDIERSRSLGANSYIIKASTTPTEVVEKAISVLRGAALFAKVDQKNG